MMGFVMDSSQEKQKEEQNEEQKEEQLDAQSEEQLDAQSENTSEEQIDEPKEEQTKEQNSLYVPETLLLPQNFGDLINNQEFLLPIHLLVNDDNSFEKKSATASEKYKLLCLYKSLISTYCKDGAVINIFNAYENDLKSASQEEQKLQKQLTK